MQSQDITLRAELTTLVKKIRQDIPSGSFILLEGALGTGKTEFVKEFLGQMGFEGVTSPTFSLHQKYEIQNQIYHHFDLYRVKNFSELGNIGFDEILSASFELAFIEWPHDFFKHDVRVSKILKFKLDSDNKRIVTF